MNESCHVWLWEELLCPKELVELKAIKHKYHMWKDYLERDNEQIVKWNARAREVHQREICSRVVAKKQGVPEDFWFKPYTSLVGRSLCINDIFISLQPLISEELLINHWTKK